ncbi:serine protease [Amycolatopsis sp. OK19-0408]|uniref:Serine protease n=1 Tax=Amycolatopsis iheyensis TaxID=2945988 RepID=A0A9X2NPV3_9PSEU|nr:trypsin-like peptidase domain-containing protein [Amycolatopsis iheyensis]MCR6489675.1 serine protease [Amycolatopsis iheyensis]
MRVRRSAVLLSLAAVLLLGAAFVVVVAARQTRTADATTPDVVEAVPVSTPDLPAVSSPAIGALFIDGAHYCTASVVHSQQGDVLLTAAHCIHDGEGGDYLGGVTFAPAYHDGVAPFGFWTVSDELVAPGWSASSDPDLDVGFATAHQVGATKPLESLVGANTLGTGGPFEQAITLTGYPDDSEAPAVCQNTTSKQDTYQRKVDCAGFPTGTSGGPWVTGQDPKTRLGTVIGVIGGFEYGGDDPDTSYSSYFDTDVQALYRQTTARA